MRENYLTSAKWLEEGRLLCSVQLTCELGTKSEVLDMGTIIYAAANRYILAFIAYGELERRRGKLWGENFQVPRLTYHGKS